MPYTYWAFISYSTSDAPTARWLQREIELYPVPKAPRANVVPPGLSAKRLFPVARDRTDFGADSSLPERIHKALEQSYALIVVCSPRAARSRWVNEEVEYFINLGRADRILSLIASGEPNGPGSSNCFPSALCKLEPVAADLRPTGDGRKIAKLKLLAGLLGVSLDTLMQRDSQRQMRNLRAVTAIALVACVGIGTIGWYVDLQRQESESARHRAEQVLDFLVYDVSDQLRKSGNPELGEALQRQVDDYFRQLGPDAQKTRALITQADAANINGTLALQRGNIDAALEQFGRAQVTYRRLASQNPEDSNWLYRLSVSQANVGDAQRLRGEIAEAQAAYQSSAALIERAIALVADEPLALWLHQLSAARRASAAIFLDRGYEHEGLRSYREALKAAQALRDLDPRNPIGKGDFAEAQIGIGDALTSIGDYSAAVHAYESGVKVQDGLLRDDPFNTEIPPKAHLAYSALGTCYRRLGRLTDARAAFNRALSIATTERAADPESEEAQVRQLDSLLNATIVARALNDPLAFVHWEQAKAQLNHIRRRNISTSTSVDARFREAQSLFE